MLCTGTQRAGRRIGLFLVFFLGQYIKGMDNFDKFANCFSVISTWIFLL